jgi:hypothetical protein
LGFVPRAVRDEQQRQAPFKRLGKKYHHNQQQQHQISLRMSQSTNADRSLSSTWRSLLFQAVAASFLATGPLLTAPPPAVAAPHDPATVYLSGKDPKIPGQKPRDKKDISGTRKDPNFLRSLADCKNQCENTLGSDGYAKTKEECLSECQDICCTTYQQCTFAIVPRI